MNKIERVTAVTLTPQQMDAKMDEHFAFEGNDDVEGVLATLTDDVEALYLMSAFYEPGSERGARRGWNTDRREGTLTLPPGKRERRLGILGAPAQTNQCCVDRWLP